MTDPQPAPGDDSAAHGVRAPAPLRMALPDGRKIAFRIYGDPEGAPLFYFHGWPGSSSEASLYAEAADAAGVRIFAFDRPGMGGSDPQPRRTLLDWAADVAALGDTLGLKRFPVLGVSGGGPYAAACAYAIPERLTACGLLAALGPLELGTKDMVPGNRVLYGVARRLPFLVRPMLRMSFGRILAPPEPEEVESRLAEMLSDFPEPDGALMQRPEILRWMATDLREAFQQGLDGPARDLALYTRRWPFVLEDIACPVHVWHGGRDASVPPRMGRAYAERIPGASATLLPDEGHLSMVLASIDVVLRTLSRAR